MTDPPEITELLLALGRGEDGALERLTPLVIDELRVLASRYMGRERQGHLLQTTALINEAYLKLIDQRRVQWRNRQHFYAVAATCMRRILCDHARAEMADRRGGRAAHVPVSEAEPLTYEKAAELLALDEALNKLSKQDERKSRVVELRYFGGYSVEEVAEMLGLSERTVAKDWEMARDWLRRELTNVALGERSGGRVS